MKVLVVLGLLVTASDRPAYLAIQAANPDGSPRVIVILRDTPNATWVCVDTDRQCTTVGQLRASAHSPRP